MRGDKQVDEFINYLLGTMFSSLFRDAQSKRISIAIFTMASFQFIVSFVLKSRSMNDTKTVIIGYGSVCSFVAHCVQ